MNTNNLRKLFLRCFMPLIVLSICQPDALASSKQVDSSARAVLRAHLDLQKLVEQYHLAAASWNYNRGKRTWFYDFCNGVSTEAGLIDAVALNFAHSNDQAVKQVKAVYTPQGSAFVETEKHVHAHIPRTKVAGTLYPQIAGQLVGGGGALIESGIDVHHFFKLRNQKFLRKQITHRVALKVKEINSLIAEFEQQSGQEINHELYKAESVVLRGMVTSSVTEFLRLERRATLMQSANVIDDDIGFLRNAVGAVGNSLNVAAAFKSSKRLNGQGAICNLVSASLLITRPVFTTAGSELTALRCRATRRMLKELTGNSSDENYDLAHSDLDRAINDATLLSTKYDDPNFTHRNELYKKELVEYDKERTLAQSEHRQWNHNVARRARETLYGPTKATQASFSIVENFRKLDNTTADARLSAAGNTTYASGQFLNILELVRERVIDSSEHNRERKAEQLPEQQIARSLQNISSMQQILDR